MYYLAEIIGNCLIVSNFSILQSFAKQLHLTLKDTYFKSLNLQDNLTFLTRCGKELYALFTLFCSLPFRVLLELIVAWRCFYFNCDFPSASDPLLCLLLLSFAISG